MPSQGKFATAIPRRTPWWGVNRLISSGVAVALLGMLAMVVQLTATKKRDGQQAEAKTPAAVLGMPGTRTFRVWTAGALPPEIADAARGVPGVAAVTEVRSGTLWLSGWAPVGAPGISTPPPGLSVPMDVAAIDPEQYQVFLPPEEGAEIAQLTLGSAFMGRTGAELRGIADLGALVFGGSLLAVQGVVDDPLVSGYEVVVSQATGAGLGIVNPRYLLIAVSPEVPFDQVERDLRALAPSGSMGIREHGGADLLNGASVLPLAQLKKLFGEFSGQPRADGSIRIDQAWIDSNTPIVSLPLLGETRCHKAIVPQITGAIQEIVDKGLGELVRDFGGCFGPRFINGNASLGVSHHAWGVAFDINVSRNLYGHPPTLDPRIVEIIEKWGFTWGGRWLVPDGMHFEAVRLR